MKYFLVSYIKIRSGKVQMCNTVEKAESLRELYRFFTIWHRAILYVDEVTSLHANIYLNTESNDLLSRVEA